MNKIALLVLLGVTVGIVVAGCSSKQPYSGYATYNPQGGGGAQPVPIAGGCGVAAPEDVIDDTNAVPLSSGL